MSNLPSGEIPRGAIRFNTDSNKPELWDGSQWAEFQLSSPALGRGADTGPGARGIFGGGNNPGLSPVDRTTIDYINISSTGDAQDFGDLTTGRANPGCCSSQTRAIWLGGEAPGVNAEIDFVTISSTGSAVDWGVNLDTARRYLMGCGNQTRGIFGGGGTPAVTNVIQYVTISSAGTRSDFGDLTVDNMVNAGACSNATRGVFIDGNSITAGRHIQAVTIATTGDAQNFGDVIDDGDASRSCANTVRGLIVGAGQRNTMEYVTISSLGNSIDFGDLSQERFGIGATGDKIRAIFGGGWTPTMVDTIDYVQFMSQGNAVDFGNLFEARREPGAGSNAHGGL